MTFSESVKTCLMQKYVTFSGRASRSEYWWFFLFQILVTLIPIGIGVALAAASGGMETGQMPLPAMILMGLGALIALALILPSLSVHVRRFHDKNLSGWLYLVLLLAGMIPMVGFLASIAILVICALRGTAGPNKFGADPLNPHGGADVFS